VLKNGALVDGEEWCTGEGYEKEARGASEE